MQAYRVSISRLQTLEVPRCSPEQRFTEYHFRLFSLATLDIGKPDEIRLFMTAPTLRKPH